MVSQTPPPQSKTVSQPMRKVPICSDHLMQFSARLINMQVDIRKSSEETEAQSYWCLV